VKILGYFAALLLGAIIWFGGMAVLAHFVIKYW